VAYLQFANNYDMLLFILKNYFSEHNSYCILMQMVWLIGNEYGRIWMTMNDYEWIWLNMNVSQVAVSSNKGFLPPCYYTSHQSCQMAKMKNLLLRFGHREASSSCEALGIHPCANILGAKANTHNIYNIMYIYTPWFWYMIMAQSLVAILEARRDTWIINHLSYW